MKTEILTARLDPETKSAFTLICEEIGLSPSQAIKLFAKAVINHGGIPFELKSRQPNPETIEAMNQLIRGEGHKTESVDALLEELTEGKVKRVYP